MTIQAPPVASVTRLPPPDALAARRPDRGAFARVYDLALARDLRELTVPPEALDAVESAARACEELDARGLSVRFTLRAGTGVGAELHDRALGTVRPLALRDVVDPDGLLPPAA